MTNLKISIRPRRIFENLIIIFLTAILLTAVSACQKDAIEEPDQKIPDLVENNTSTTTGGEDIDTSNWKTYRNEELGFEIKLPDDWGEAAFGMENLTEEEFKVSSKTKYFNRVVNNVADFQQMLTITLLDEETKIDNNYIPKTSYVLSNVLQRNEQMIDGVKFIKYDIEGVFTKDNVEKHRSTIYYIYSSNILLELDFYHDIDKKIIKAMINTFKIIK